MRIGTYLNKNRLTIKLPGECFENRENDVECCEHREFESPWTTVIVVLNGFENEGMGLNVLKKRRFENECLSGIIAMNAKIARELENIFQYCI